MTEAHADATPTEGGSEAVNLADGVCSAEILSPGPLAMIQDLGRVGSQHLGIGVSGAVDTHAAGWANRLLGNSADAPLVEICLGNFRLRFNQPSEFALAGARMYWQLDGQPLRNWRSHRASAGEVLEAAFATEGLRGYLALPGGIRAPQVCGSCATNMSEGLGGLSGNGRPLTAGDQLNFSPASSTGLVRQVPAQFRRSYEYQVSDGAALTLRVVPSNQFAEFSDSSIRHFWNSRFEVTQDSDRMGVRLWGSALPQVPTNLVSEAVSPGAIQVPASGLPIVLMADCQTIGGYPKLGHVYRVDLDRVAQARPGTMVQFVPGERSESQHEWLLQQQFFSDVEERKNKG